MMAALIVTPSLMTHLPDDILLHKKVENGVEVGMPLNWVAWLSAIQLSLALLCFAIVRLKRTKAIEVVAGGSAIWFALQAVDEWLTGNFFGLGAIGEYIALAILCIATYLYLRKHERYTNA